MSGAGRYWNEDAQRWDERGDPGTPPAGVSPSPVRPAGPPDTAWPVPAAPAPDPGAPRAGRRALWAVAAVVVAAVVVAGAVVTRVAGDGRADRAGSSASPAVSRGDHRVGGEPSAGAGTPAGAALPEGYRLVHDAEGFSAAVLEGWKRGTPDGAGGTFWVPYESPEDPARYLVVSEVAEATLEESVEAVGRREGYEQLADPEPFERDTVTGRLLGYRLDGETDGTWYVVDIRFQAADGKQYSVAAWQADDPDLTEERSIVDTATSNFCPPETDCGIS
ncbi:hypothetical protein [Streptomyces rubradiris]|uniref:Serine/arginine repetitive matrix protein 2 n=1 Tax=Streptomyces rubradiris TaxID=285531 RepID=A0ABQ3RHA7_STRRR|nr:hypothetical protein [Streptomyces rubradiris]GHH27077.1 hypothetical protein GCM10018792_68480 [Streptomyces rubradiris]GHI55241.1 hypothetical protein Srubr_50870 [Streptomyces rubradiris]